jgi:hypothetical protein
MSRRIRVARSLDDIGNMDGREILGEWGETKLGTLKVDITTIIITTIIMNIHVKKCCQ